MKIAVIIGYSISRVQCQDKGYYYSWLQALGIFRCDPCDLRYVDVKSRHSVEGCINRTLAHPRPVDKLIHDLHSIAGNSSDVKELKLSYQNWTQYSRPNLSKFLDELSQLFPHVLSLDLSYSDQVALTSWQADLMAQFLGNMSSLESFDSSGIVWPNQSIALLANSISGLGIQKLVLDNTDLNATGHYYWVKETRDKLEYLSCSNSTFLSNGSKIKSLPSLPVIQ